jgi:hypothetical protein
MKFLYKTVVVVIIVIIGQIVIGKYFIRPIPEMTLINKDLAEKYQVIYFGDSVLDTVAPGDTDKSTIVQMLSKLASSTTIADFSHGAYHLGIYDSYVQYMAHSSSKPQAVIVPINLAEFSPGWDMRPGYQFDEENFDLTTPVPFAQYFFRPLAIFQAIHAVTEEQYEKTPVYRGTAVVGTVAEFSEPLKYASITPAHMADQFVFDYMYNLTPMHRKLVSLQHLIATARAAGIAVYVYITPIDYENGVKYVGPDFLSQTKANTDVICSVLASNNMPCLNLAFSLRSNIFNYPVYANEHMKQQGRLFVATQIANTFFKVK